MKKLYSLVAAFCAAVISLNAQTTEEYDFSTLIEADTQAEAVWGDAVYVESVDATASHGGMTGGQTLELNYIYGPNGETFNNRIAGHNRNGSWKYRHTKDNVWNGLWSQYDRWFAVIGLHNGDVVKFRLSFGASIKFDDIFAIDEEDPQEMVANEYTEGGDRTSSEFTLHFYTEKETADLVMYTTTGSYIEKITIESNSSSSIETLQSETSESAYYDLMGRPSKGNGLIISRSRKVFVK